MKKIQKLPRVAGRHLLAAASLLLLAPAAHADYSSLVLADHPLAYYPLVVTNSVAKDLTGNGNDGQYVNIYNNLPGPSAYIPYAANFDGLTTFVDLSTGANATSLNFGGQITLEAWVQPSTTSANGYIIGKGYDSGNGGDEIVLRCPGFGVYQGGTFNFTDGDRHATGGTVTTDWTYVVTTFDGSQWNLYVNGGLVGTQADTVGSINCTTPWAIGDGTADGGTRIFPGNIAAVGIYSNSLSPRQVAAHYVYGLNGTTNVAPIISTQPSPAVAVPGASAAFSVTIISPMDVTSQWYKNNVAISGATNLTLSLTNLQTTDSGNYTIKVTSLAGTTTSLPANLLVLTPGAYGVSPVALLTNSFTQDAIVENTAIPAATTASVDAGVQNTDYSWYETGFNFTSGNGLPPAGSTVVSLSQGDHSYQMAPSYTANDAFLIDSSVTAATMSLTTPTVCSSLSFLLSSGGGSTTIGYKVYHADGSAETGTLTSPDWFGPTTVAIAVNGRVNVNTRNLQTWGSGGPSVCSQDITLSNPGSAVTKIDLTYTSGGHACILAVSGSSGSSFNPIAVTGYNEDMIVEASAPGFVGGAYTTASVDNSTANTQFSWYEDGFEIPGRGLPKHGRAITSQAQADHTFDMPPSYTNNDVALVDANNTATLTLAQPAKLWRLSFLGASGHGPVNLRYVVHHADSSTESGTFALPDWFGGGTIAWAVNGRVDVGNGNLQTWGSGGPRLLSVDIGVTNINSAVTSVDLSFGTGNQNGASAEILALSGAYINQSRVFTGIGGSTPTLTFAGIPGYRYVAQYTTSLAAPTTWTSLGTNTANSSGIWTYTDTGAASHPRAYYRALWLP